MEPKIYLVYRNHITDDGRGVTEELAGKYALIDGTVHVLEAHFGILERIKDQPTDSNTLRYIFGLQISPYYKIIDTDSMEYQLKNAPLDDGEVSADAGKGPSAYEYVNNEGKHLIEFRDAKVYLDGTEITPVEAKKLLEHNAQGIAKIQFKAE